MTLMQVELTDELITEAQSQVGRPLRIEQYNHEVTEDTVRHWSWGIGDDNPLYCDLTYGASGPYGDIVAPASWLNTVYAGHIGAGLAGVQPFGAGCHWEFYDVLRRGDRITVSAKVGPVSVKQGRKANRFIIQTTESEYRRQDGTLVARSQGRTARIPRAKVSGGLKYEPRAPQAYTQEQLEKIRLAAVNEPRRGATQRYAQDLSVGDVVPDVVKGPIDMTMQCAYYTGRAGSPRQKACEMAWKYHTWAVEDPERLPNEYDPTYYSELVAPSAGHLHDTVAHDLGMPGAYNNGTQTAAWLMHAVTNWMGDHAFITLVDVSFRRPIVFYDTVWCGGKVAGIDGDSVTLELAARSQLGEVAATATAVVALPSPADGSNVIPSWGRNAGRA